MTVGAAAPPMRLGGGGKKRDWKALATKVLAYTSFFLGMAAGSLLAGTAIAGLVRFAAGVIDGIVNAVLNLIVPVPSGWVPLFLLVGAVVAICMDIFNDGIPNRVALCMAMLAPSLATAVPGGIGAAVQAWWGRVLSWMDGPLGQWLGTTTGLGLAATAALVAWLVARRTMPAKASPAR